jgi:nickel/cobalt transporter (NiCoT) family protein
MTWPGVLLMFLLGFRHGFDPDHIAIIDGISVRYSSKRPQLAKWTGTLFALGHGSVVTVIAVMISQFSHAFSFSEKVWAILDWVPGILLIVVGVINLRSLLSKERFHSHGLKTWLLPEKLKNSSHPLSIVLIGILFAMVFDTNTQAAAWAYSASSGSGCTHALMLGLCFTAGMMLTDSMDSQMLFLLTLHSSGTERVIAYRRKLGWVIVAITFSVGLYKIVSHINPLLELSESVLTAIGISLFFGMGIFYTKLSIFVKHKSHNESKLNTE